jgi:hypothetical protein
MKIGGFVNPFSQNGKLWIFQGFRQDLSLNAGASFIPN